MKYGFELGLVQGDLYEQQRKKWERVKERISFLSTTFTKEGSLVQLLRRPEIKYDDLAKQVPECLEPDSGVKAQVETEIKYEGYIQRERALVERFKKLEERKIPLEFSYQEVKGIRREAKEKLTKIRPVSVGQAARISGITPCDISLLLVTLEQKIS